MGTLQTTIKLNDEVSKKLNNINRAINRTVNAMNNLNNIASGKAVRNINKLAELESKRGTQIERNTQAYHSQNSAVSQQINQHNTIMKQLGQWATKLRNISTIYYGIQKAIQMTGSIINLSDKMTMADARLGLMSDKDDSVSSLKTKAFAASQRATTDYLNFTKAVTKMGILAGDKFADQDSIIRFTELMQKQFQLAGADTSERNAAMLQLTQAIASNRLGGDELRTIRETAPLLVKYIQESLGVGEAAFKDLAKEGKITADVIIKAMAESADKVEKMYAKLPLTGERVWTRMKNVGIMAFQPIHEQFNRLFNNQRFLKFIVAIQNGFIALGRIVGWAFKSIFDLFGNIADFFQRCPILVDILKGALIVLATIGFGWLISVVWKAIVALSAFIAKQIIVNGVVALFGLITGNVFVMISLLILAFYGVIAAINHFAGTSISATGIIAGAFMWLVTSIQKLFWGLVYALAPILNAIVNPCIKVAEIVYNAFNDGFTSWVGGVASVIGDFIAWVLGKIKPLVEVWDKFKGTNYAASLTATQNKVSGWGKTSAYKKFDSVDFNAIAYNKLQSLPSLSEAYNKGYNWGSNLESKLGEGWDKLTKLDLDMSKAQLEALNGINNGVGDMTDSLGDIAGSGGDTAKNTGDTAKNTSSKYEQDYSYLRNWAYNKGVGNSIGYNIKIEQNNKNNIGSNMDLNRVVDAVRDAIIEGIYTQAEGVR